MKKLHIGLLVDEISNNFSQLICEGALEACQKIGAKLSIFFGGYYMNTFQEYGYQKNMIYPIANTDDLDFLIVSIASICRSTANKQKILDYFNNVPIITLNQIFDGHSAVLFDNKAGLYEGLEYIFSHSFYRSFAMVAGPKNNYGSNIRISVFEDVLKKHGLEKEIYVEHAPIMERTSKDTVRLIFKNKPQTNVLICANDELAIAAYDVCKEQKRVIGKDILILGFDDIHEASSLQPALSSIKSPIEQLGYEAVMQGSSNIDSKDTFVHILPTKFILRNSLGKINDSDILVKTKTEALFKKEVEFDAFWESIVDYLLVDILELKEMMHTIHSLDLNSKDTYNTLEIQVRKFFSSAQSLKKVDTLMFIQVFRVFLHYYIMHTLYDSNENYMNAIRYYERIAFEVISQLNTNITQIENQRDGEYQQINALARNVMIFANEEECHDNILQAMLDIDIQNAKMYLFDHEVECNTYEELPESLYLAGEIKDGKKSQCNFKEYISLQDIMKSSIDWPTNKPIYVLSIYSKSKLFGYILCEISLEKYVTMEFLSIHIGTSLQMLRLMLDLQYQSRMDALTGLYNRRGMDEKAYNYYEKNKEDGTLYILLADMDDLKVINDCYGHKAGDIAIQKGAKILRNALGKDAFIARIGGDEYLAICKAEKNQIEKAMHQAHIDVNLEIPQQKDTCLSYGYRKIKNIGRFDLEGLIKEVDLLMYKHKQSKKED